MQTDTVNPEHVSSNALVKQQVMYRDIAAYYLHLFRCAVDPEVPAWDALDEADQRHIANVVVETALTIESRPRLERATWR